MIPTQLQAHNFGNQPVYLKIQLRNVFKNTTYICNVGVGEGETMRLHHHLNSIASTEFILSQGHAWFLEITFSPQKYISNIMYTRVCFAPEFIIK